MTLDEKKAGTSPTPRPSLSPPRPTQPDIGPRSLAARDDGSQAWLAIAKHRLDLSRSIWLA